MPVTALPPSAVFKILTIRNSLDLILRYETPAPCLDQKSLLGNGPGYGDVALSPSVSSSF